MPTVNISTHLTEMAKRQPNRDAVLFPASRDQKGLTTYHRVTYEQLDRQSDYLAAGLDAIGVGRGTKTVLMVPPSIEFFSLTFALFKAGAVPVLVDPGMGIKNLGACLAEAAPTAFIGVTKAQVARLLFGWSKRSLQTVVTVGRRLGWAGQSFHGVIAQGEKRQTDPDRTHDRWQAADTDTDETAAILFTSGSTGVPKGAVYSHGNFAAQVEALKQAFSIKPGEMDLCTFPLFALFAPALGMSAVVPRMDFTRPAKVDPREIDEPVRQFQINNLFGSPALLNRVGRELVTEDTSTSETLRRWPTINRILSAGAPVSPLILERFAKLIPPQSQIFTPYGATESLPVAIVGSHDILSETRYLTAKGAGTCVGRPVGSIDVRIIKISDGPIEEWDESLCLPKGEIGEIVVHGPMVTQSYYQRADLTRLAKIHDRSTGRMRHRMGDVGYFDNQGRLWFCGRKSHRVMAADRTYFTEPVEGVFNTHPAVFRTALVGVKRGASIEPVLCVEREKTDRSEFAAKLSNAELVIELRNLGFQYEHTNSIKTILFHPSFPVDIRHNSKIFREKLAVWAAKQVR